MAPVVELLLDGAWVDITSYVRTDPGITTVVGVPNESGIADPATCHLTVNNRDGRFSPRNAAGPYYGHLTRNTPLRITDGGSPRFAGEISEFPARWNLPGTDVWTPLVASGILRRLNRGRQIDSPMVTGLRNIAAAGHIVGYWPLEDLPGASSFASEVAGAPAGAVMAGAPVLAAVDPGEASNPIPTWNLATGSFFPVTSTGTGFTAGFWLVVPEGGTTDFVELVRIYVNGTGAAASILYWSLRYSAASDGRLYIQAVTAPTSTAPAGVALLNTALGVTNGLNGKAIYVKLEANTVGANVEWYVQPYGHGVGTGATIAGTSTGTPSGAYIGLGQQIAGEVGVGHLILGDTSTALFLASFDLLLRAYDGETAEDRVARIADLAGVMLAVEAGTVDSTALGPQPAGSAVEIMRDAEKADVGGILYDALDVVGLVYITRAARYSRAVTVALDYAETHLSPPLDPTDDDQFVRNDVTAARVNGSAARKVETAGPLNAQNYPDGIGPYPFYDTYNLHDDGQLEDQAAWLLGQGTIDETRWPRITVDLIKHPSLVASVEMLRPGYRMTVENLPTWQGTGTADLHVIGWTETWGPNYRSITFNCEPGGAASGYNVFILDDSTYGVLDANNRLGF